MHSEQTRSLRNSAKGVQEYAPVGAEQSSFFDGYLLYGGTICLDESAISGRAPYLVQGRTRCMGDSYLIWC